MNREILLLAIGDKEYGHWARNMAVSIKYHTDIKIRLIHDNKAITGISLDEVYDGARIFDNTVIIDYDDCHINGKLSPGLAKTCIHKYSSAESVMYLDVDGVCVKDLSLLFNEFDSNKKVFCSHVWRYGSSTDKEWGYDMMWSTPDSVWRHFELSDKAIYPFINSSLMIFNDKGRSVFELARKLMLEKPMPLTLMKILWGKGNQPDELYFNAACAILEIKPHFRSNPMYFRAQKDRGKDTTEQDIENYYVVGLWGDSQQNHHSMYKLYDNMMRKYLLEKETELPYHIKAHQLMRKKFVRTH